MLQLPDRLAQVRQALERGEKPNLEQIAQLQALDLAIAGRRYVEEAIAAQEAEDVRIRETFTARL